MKINKTKLIESKKLREAEDDWMDAFGDGFDDEDVEGNIEIDDKKDLKKGIVADVEGQMDVTPNKETVNQIESEIEYVSNLYDIDLFAPLGAPNALTETLDDALETALTNGSISNVYSTPASREAAYSRCNVLVTGLPGSGKTAIVKAWAKARGINLHAVNAKNNDLELAINGAIMRDMSDPNSNRITQAYSKYLTPLERPKSVLFLDELNRQTDPQIRASLLTLVGEHCIYGSDNEEHSEDKDGYHFFKNLLFTVACINPAVSQDPGASALNDAEKSRYLKGVDYDSNKSDARSFFKWHYDSLMKDLNKKDPMYVIAYKTLYIRKELALHIVENPSFKFDTRADLTELYNQQKTMLNQRLLHDAIEDVKYRDRHGRDAVEQLLAWIGATPDQSTVAKSAKNPEDPSIAGANGMSNLLDRDKKMLQLILSSFEIEDDIKVPGVANTKKASADEVIPTDEIDDIDDDISEDELNSATVKGGSADDLDSILGGFASDLDSIISNAGRN